MPVTSNLQTLPIWILLIFAVLLIGIITLIYSQGNWRTTLSFTGIAIALVLAIVGITIWKNYLDTHFIGQFDSLGIPFRKAGPGWGVLLEAWPLWLVPIGLTAIFLFTLDWLIRRLLVSDQPSPQPRKVLADTVEPLNTIAKKLEIETLKRELHATQERLIATTEISERQLDKKEELEIKLSQLKEQQQDTFDELEDKIAALTLEIESKETQVEELSNLTLQQAEEISNLKSELTDISSAN